MDARETAIRRNEVHIMLEDVRNRIRWAQRSDRMADNEYDRAKAKAVVSELYSLKTLLYMRLKHLKECE